MKFKLSCRHCSLSDTFEKLPKKFKCPYCGNDTYWKTIINEKV